MPSQPPLHSEQADNYLFDSLQCPFPSQAPSHTSSSRNDPKRALSCMSQTHTSLSEDRGQARIELLVDVWSDGPRTNSDRPRVGIHCLLLRIVDDISGQVTRVRPILIPCLTN